MAIPLLIPDVPDSADKERVRLFVDRVRSVLNALIRAQSIVPGSGIGTSSLNIVDADIPATITRDTELTAAIAALSSVYQPLDSDLTAIAALATTSFGRGLLILADAAALRTAGSVYSIAQVDAGFQPLDSDLTSIAALSTTSYGRSLLTLANSAALLAALKVPIPLFEFNADVGNSTTTETDIFTSTLAAGQLANNKEKIETEYAGVFVSSATATRQLKVYFGGTVIFDSGALTLSLSAAWVIYVTVIRVSSSVVRTSVSMTTEGAALASYTQYAEVTGLTLANNQVMKITGQAAGVGAASGDITGKLGWITWVPAA